MRLDADGPTAAGVFIASPSQDFWQRWQNGGCLPSSPKSSSNGLVNGEKTTGRNGRNFKNVQKCATLPPFREAAKMVEYAPINLEEA